MYGFTTAIKLQTIVLEQLVYFFSNNLLYDIFMDRIHLVYL